MQAVAVLAVLAAVLRRRRASRDCYGGSGVVDHRRRGGVSVRHGQVLQLSPVEAAMVKLSHGVVGAARVTAVMTLRGHVSEQLLRRAVRAWQLQQPMLLAKVVRQPCGDLVLVVDAAMEVPVTIQHSNDGETVDAAWRREWRNTEKV
jgi:hypothetical protein